MTVDIATPSPAWGLVEKVRRFHRWLTEVSSASRTTTELELPREVGEQSVQGIDPWAVRMRKAVLEPDYPMGVWSWIGRVVGEEYRLDTEGDKDLATLYTDIDRAGSDLKVFLQTLFEDLLMQASPFVLVEDQPGGGAPFWTLFTADQVRRAEWGKSVDGSLVPKRIHLWNPARATLRREKRCRVRVLLGDGEPSWDPETGRPGPGEKLGDVGARWEWWEEAKENGVERWRPSTAPDEQPGRFIEDEIPGKLFQVGRRDRTDRDAVYPMSEWLGEACLHKFREYSDHSGFVRMLRTMILFWQGLGYKEFAEANKDAQGNNGNVVTFSHFTILFGGTNAAAMLHAIETSGSAAALSFQAMQDVESKVTLAKLMPVEPQKVQTLGEAQLSEHAAMMPLSVAATHLRDGAEYLMKVTAARLGKQKPGTLHIPTTFTLSDAEEKDLAMVRDLQKEGRLSWRTSMEKLKLGNEKLEDIDLVAELKLMAEEQKAKDEAAARRVRNVMGGEPMGEGT